MIEFYECLRNIEMIMMKAIGPRLHELGFSRTEIFILTRLYFKKEARMTELAKATGIPASSFTGIVDRLEKRAYVVRENDANDRRSILIRGTPKLRETVEHIFRIGNEVFAEVLKPAPDSLIRRLTADLNELYGYIAADNGGDAAVNKTDK
jgi:DNA-binding MarR family transcriptional regulator